MADITEPCCETWAKAHESGSDSEGYEALIKGDGNIGDGLPPVRFCPWCGAKKQSSSASPSQERP